MQENGLVETSQPFSVSTEDESSLQTSSSDHSNLIPVSQSIPFEENTQTQTFSTSSPTNPSASTNQSNITDPKSLMIKMNNGTWMSMKEFVERELGPIPESLYQKLPLLIVQQRLAFASKS